MLPVGYLPCTQDPPSGANMGRVIDDIVAEGQVILTQSRQWINDKHLDKYIKDNNIKNVDRNKNFKEIYLKIKKQSELT